MVLFWFVISKFNDHNFSLSDDRLVATRLVGSVGSVVSPFSAALGMKYMCMSPIATYVRFFGEITTDLL